MVTGLFAGQHNTKLHGTITIAIRNFKTLTKGQELESALGINVL